MNIPDLYRKIKQVLNNSNAALINKGLNNVESLSGIPNELNKLDGINRLPYVLNKEIVEVLESDFNDITAIKESAFQNCTALTSITIPDSVTSIGRYAFENTGYYNNVSNWANKVLYICNHLIEAYASIISCNIRQGTKSIGNSAFSDCSSLTSITIPDSVTLIGGRAFQNCTALTNITIPDSVTSIGDYAFSGCSGLRA